MPRSLRIRRPRSLEYRFACVQCRAHTALDKWEISTRRKLWRRSKTKNWNKYLARTASEKNDTHSKTTLEAL